MFLNKHVYTHLRIVNSTLGFVKLFLLVCIFQKSIYYRAVCRKHVWKGSLTDEVLEMGI